MATNASTRYDDITYKRLIRSGSPTVYQLTPKTEKIGTLKKMTLGKKDPSKVNKTILLVGETGTGKSTLINALVNYAMGVTWKDNVWFEIVEDEKRDQCESQTSDVIVYEIFGFEGKPLSCSLTIIDTPGYGDTRGADHDEVITTRLFELLRSEDSVCEMNVVGLVLKSTENRLSDRLMYIFDSVVSLFAKDMEKNIVCLITHSDGTTPEDVLTALKEANVKCAKDKKDKPVHFLFNNNQKKDRTENKRPLKYAFEVTMDGMSDFGEFLLNTAPQSLKKTVAVLNERDRLTACIENLKEQVEMIEKQQKGIQEIQVNLKKHEDEMIKNKNFTIEVTEVYKVKEDIKGAGRGGFLWLKKKGAVCCTVCEENCHYNCEVAWGPSLCKVMRNDYCTSCSGKCHVSRHVKEQWRYVQKTKKSQKTVDDVKAKYFQSAAASKDTSSLLATLQMEMTELKKAKDQRLADSFGHIVKLEQIALTADSFSTIIHLDFLIEKMKENRDTEKVQKLEEMKSRVNKGTRAGLSYRHGRQDK